MAPQSEAQSLAVAMGPSSGCAMLSVNRKRVREDAEDAEGEPVASRRRRARSVAAGSEVEVAMKSGHDRQDGKEGCEKKREEPTVDGSPTEVTDLRALDQPRAQQARLVGLPDLETAAATTDTSTSSATQVQDMKRSTDVHRPMAPRRARRPPLGDRGYRARPNRALFRLSGLGIVRCRQLLDSAVDGEETEDDSDPAPAMKPRTESVAIPVLPIDLESCNCFEDDGEVVAGHEEEWQVHSPAPYPGFDPTAASPENENDVDAGSATVS